ncbi:MAG: tRNA preQ1(34) S-adenosylmethionine ribosyltransferase-isomerase QueA [Candidatus Methylomirabilia bacterium]
MDVTPFDYCLPPDRIAQYPAERREASRLLVLDRASGRWEDRVFADLPGLLQGGDCLVLNDSRVIPARFHGQLGSGKAVECLFLREVRPHRWEILAKPAKHARVGSEILLGQGRARIVQAGALGRRVIDVEGVPAVRDFLERHGLPPLPPYIAHYAKPGAEDWERYQTVYARHEGSVAAPTAGLHFTPALLEELRVRGVEVHALTLHVGPGSFRPIRADRVEAHVMEEEEAMVPEAVGQAVNRARDEGRRVLAVGTTVVRALESAARQDGRVRAFSGPTSLFIVPGYRFKIVDGLITNFHLPRSTHLLLVSAFAGRERILAAYRHAVDVGYRFYSYGDAVLLL